MPTSLQLQVTAIIDALVRAKNRLRSTGKVTRTREHVTKTKYRLKLVGGWLSSWRQEALHCFNRYPHRSVVWVRKRKPEKYSPVHVQQPTTALITTEKVARDCKTENRQVNEREHSLADFRGFLGWYTLVAVEKLYDLVISPIYVPLVLEK